MTVDRIYNNAQSINVIFICFWQNWQIRNTTSLLLWYFLFIANKKRKNEDLIIIIIIVNCNLWHQELFLQYEQNHTMLHCNYVLSFNQLELRAAYTTPLTPSHTTSLTPKITHTVSPHNIQSWSEYSNYSNYSNSSVQILLFVFIFVGFFKVE